MSTKFEEDDGVEGYDPLECTDMVSWELCGESTGESKRGGLRSDLFLFLVASFYKKPR